MCCNKRRQARLNAYGGYGYGSCRTSPAGSNIAAIVGSLQQMRLGNGQVQQQVPVSNQMLRAVDAQTQGVTYLSAQDEKRDIKFDEKLDFEELPSYEASTGESDRRIPAQTTPTIRQDAQEVKIGQSQVQLQHQPSNRMVLMGLEHFNTGLEAYRNGDNKSAKRAAKSFVRDLYAQEVERRRSARGGGCLECGERKQIRRELQPLKEMMKEAVREAKIERRMQRAA